MIECVRTDYGQTFEYKPTMSICHSTPPCPLHHKKIKKVVTIVNNLKHGGSQLLLGEGSGLKKQGRRLFIRTLTKIIKKEIQLKRF